jgi:hypothetical protein
MEGYSTKFIVVGMRPSCTLATKVVFREYSALKARYMEQHMVVGHKMVWMTKAKNRASVFSHTFDFEGHTAKVYFTYPRQAYTKTRLNSTTKKTMSNIVTFNVQWNATRVFCKFFQNGCVQVTGLTSSETVDAFVPTLLESMAFAWSGEAVMPRAFTQQVFLINEGCRIRDFDISRYCNADKSPQRILEDALITRLPDFAYAFSAYVRLNSLFITFLDVTCIVRFRGYCIVTRKTRDPDVTAHLCHLLNVL